MIVNKSELVVNSVEYSPLLLFDLIFNCNEGILVRGCHFIPWALNSNTLFSI